jgi:hypothetical protein
MSKIVKPDSYLPFYILEKQQNPQKKMWWLALKQRDVDTIDHLVEISKGKRETVSSAKDWEIMDELLSFFIQRWPNEFNDFKESMELIRQSRLKGGYSRSGEIKYTASLPPRLERLIKAIFPLQQFNKEFIYKLINHYKIFKVGGEKN